MSSNSAARRTNNTCTRPSFETVNTKRTILQRHFPLPASNQIVGRRNRIGPRNSGGRTRPKGKKKHRTFEFLNQEVVERQIR